MNEYELLEHEELVCPVVAIRDQVIFPNTITPVYLGRDKSLRAVEAAIQAGSPIIAVAQKDPNIEDPTPEDLYEIGVEVNPGRPIRLPDGAASITFQAQRRVKIVEFIQTYPYLKAKAIPISEEKVEKTVQAEALMRAVLALFEKIVQLDDEIPEEAYVAAMNIEDPGWLADIIASSIKLDNQRRQELLETINPLERLQKLSIFLARELDILELESKIQARVQEEMDKAQREYFLREQIRVIQDELGELDSQSRLIAELEEKIEKSDMPPEVKEKARKELERLASMPPASPEIGIIQTYLDWLLELPWTKATEDEIDLEKAARILDSRHYGLEKAKERILEYIAVKKLASNKMRSPILCFLGPPGTGKTSMGRSIAEALGRKFVRMSLGGIRDEAEIRGHRRTYIGAMPGRIIQTMRQAGTINPVFMLDEVDKIGLDFRGDPAAALLEVLDPEQNYAFYDHYLEVPYDLSKVLFITTANILDTIPPALQDRMEVIEFPGYVEEEKVHIARYFLIPRQLEEHGLDKNSIKFSEMALRRIIREYTYEAGVRNLERCIASICRKLARRVAEGKKIPSHITANSLPKYLGPPQYTYGMAEEKDEVGVATGIAWTEAGGDIMPVEVTLMEGKGNLILTGQLGEIMQESAQAALSYARSKAKELGIPNWNFDRLDIHIHVPEGAIPKDGPSAGVTIATALISALSNRPVHKDVAMTGEITLRGRILPIGGVKEKILAAHRAGVKIIVLPKKNKKDLVEIPAKIRKQLKFVFVERMEEVLPVALAPEPIAPPPVLQEQTGKRRSPKKSRT